MNKFLNNFFAILLAISTFTFVPLPTIALTFINNDPVLIVTQQKSVINYEKSQPSSIDNPVIDPNFNTMRDTDTESSLATYIVIGLLIAATIIPLVTWWYFSK